MAVLVAKLGSAILVDAGGELRGDVLEARASSKGRTRDRVASGRP